jgi:hypothetical protein
MAFLAGLGSAAGGAGGLISGLLGSLLGGGSSKGGTPAAESGAGAGRRGGNTAVGTPQAATIASSNAATGGGGLLGSLTSNGGPAAGVLNQMGDSLNANKFRKQGQYFMNPNVPQLGYQGTGDGGMGGLMLARILGLGG